MHYYAETEEQAAARRRELAKFVKRQSAKYAKWWRTERAKKTARLVDGIEHYRRDDVVRMLREAFERGYYERHTTVPR